MMGSEILERPFTQQRGKWFLIVGLIIAAGPVQTHTSLTVPVWGRRTEVVSPVSRQTMVMATKKRLQQGFLTEVYLAQISPVRMVQAQTPTTQRTDPRQAIRTSLMVIAPILVTMAKATRGPLTLLAA